MQNKDKPIRKKTSAKKLNKLEESLKTVKKKSADLKEIFGENYEEELVGRMLYFGTKHDQLLPEQAVVLKNYKQVKKNHIKLHDNRLTLFSIPFIITLVSMLSWFFSSNYSTVHDWVSSNNLIQTPSPESLSVPVFVLTTGILSFLVLMIAKLYKGFSKKQHQKTVPPLLFEKENLYKPIKIGLIGLLSLFILTPITMYLTTLFLEQYYSIIYDSYPDLVIGSSQNELTLFFFTIMFSISILLIVKGLYDTFISLVFKVKKKYAAQKYFEAYYQNKKLFPSKWYCFPTKETVRKLENYYLKVVS